MSVAGGVLIPLCTSDQLARSFGFPTDLLRFTNFNFWCYGLEVEHKSEICKTKALLLIQAAFPSPVNSKELGKCSAQDCSIMLKGAYRQVQGELGFQGLCLWSLGNFPFGTAVWSPAGKHHPACVKAALCRYDWLKSLPSELNLVLSPPIQKPSSAKPQAWVTEFGLLESNSWSYLVAFPEQPP